MKTYCKSPKVVRISTILSKKSLDPCDFGVLLYRNNNFKTIGEIVNKEDVGEQIDVKQYLAFRSGWFLGTISGMDAEIYNIEKGGENVSPIIYNKSTKKLKQGEIIISRNATLGKASYVLNEVNGILNGGLSKLYIENINTRFYVFGVLLQKFFENQLILMTSGGGTQQNAKRQNVLDCIIPFPTEKNNSNPKDIETLVSIITQNIIDKEQQIRLKNDRINNLIETELRDNQKDIDCKFKYPRVNEIKTVGRFDTGMYERKFFKLETQITNYKRGCKKLDDLGFTTRKGPNLAISVIGKSIYSEKKINNNFKQLILSKDIDEFGGIQHLQYIGNKNRLPELKQFDILLFARGNIGRVLLIDDFLIGGTSNFDVFFISGEQEYYKKIFLLNFLKYLKSINYWSYLGVGGSGADSLTDYFLKQVNFPIFPDEKQKEISYEYYNKQPRTENLNFENYLTVEKERNKKLGIFQLNMELFSLKGKLEDIIDKIIKEEPIEINFNY